MAKSITVSAPGKLMLLGEHSVVYGFPCIVTAMDTRMRVTVEFCDGDTDLIITPQVKESKFVTQSLKLFKNKFKIKQAVKIQTQGDFSHQVGLGSSSAVTVATFKALSELFNKSLSNKEIFDLSYSVTIAIQGVGSGFDIAAATFGKTVYYVYGGKVIDLIKTEELPLVVGYSGLKADTPTLVRKVKADYEINKNRVTGIFKEITLLVNKAKIAILDKNYQQLGLLMNKNHCLLQNLRVSTPKLDAMVKASIKAGVYGAKLSGAGGGDCMIALVPLEKRTEVENAITKVGGSIINVNNNAQGVRLE